MVLQARNLGISLGNRNIIKDVSISFLPDSLTYVAGLNGSGKTTLLRALAGQLPYSGSVLLRGKEIRQLKAREIAKSIAFVFQVRDTPFHFTVGEFVLMGRFPWLTTWNNYGPDDHLMAQEALEYLGIGTLAARKMDQISGGELQRVYLAQAFCQGAEIIMLDEPAQHLDPAGRYQLYEAISRLRDLGKVVLCITHDPEVLLKTGNRVLGISDGAVALDQETGASAFEKIKREIYRLPENFPLMS